MAATVADLPAERFSELAGYLRGYPPDDPGSDEGSLLYWEMIAEALRRDLPSKFSVYTNIRLASMDEHSFLEDLAQRKFPLTTLKKYLERIKCRPALNIFEETSPPVIKLQPAKNIEVIEGHPIVLEVKAECRPGQPVYQWFKGQVPITGQEKNTLLIKNSTVPNSGHYICRVTNPFMNNKGVVFSSYAMVTVVGKRETPSSNPRILQEVGDQPDSPQVSTPKILRHPAPIVKAHLHNKVELECSAEGAAVYDWYKDGQLLKSTQTSGKLVIEKAAPTDSGTYQCVAISSKGGKATSKKAKLTVAVDITITKQPEKSTVPIGGKLHLVCRATNPHNKKMKYEWFQTQANGVKKYVGEGEDFSGHLPEVTRNAELKFFCKVSFEGNSSHYIQSQIAKIKVQTVRITEQPRSIKGVIGSLAMLHCKAEGLGPITYSWFRSDTKEGRQLKPVYQSENEWYVINHLAQKHWGYYVCHAENQYENAASRRVHISAHLPTAATLSRRTKFVQPLIKILKQPWSQLIPRGGRFRLLCEAVNSGDEVLQYQWHFSGRPIAGATDSVFIRENVDDAAYGSYYCLVNTVSNTAATVSNTARIELSVRTPSPVAVIKGGAIVNGGRLEAEMELVTSRNERYARGKVALLIGNQRYNAEQLNDLKSPEGDIRELSRELEKLDFKVISLVNLRHSEIMRALEVFYKMLAVSGIYALFYYSGHGFQTPEGRNYLVPVDATVPLHLEYNIHVDGIIRQMQQRQSRAFVILDCCRSVVVNHIPEDHERHNSFESLPLGVDNISNYVEISSCVDNFTAEDIHVQAAAMSPTTGLPSSPHSFFNKALREVLPIKKKNILEVHHLVLKKFIDAGLDQRPHPRGSLADDKITLHDPVMIDDPSGQEDLLNKVLTTYQQAHTAPEPIVLRGEKHLGHELADLAKLEVEFRNEFSNVLCVTTKLVLLHNDIKTVTVKMDYDCEFLGRQGVVVEQGDCLIPSSVGESQPEQEEEEEEEGGQGEYESFFVTNLRVFDIQRLKSKQPKLKFFLTATVQTQGMDKVGKVSYEVPLTTHLLNIND